MRRWTRGWPLLLVALVLLWALREVVTTGDPDRVTDAAPHERGDGPEVGDAGRSLEPPSLVGAPVATDPVGPARPHASPESPFVLPCAAPNRLLTVTVRGQSGEPIRDVQVEVVPAPGDSFSRWLLRKLTTDGDGTVRFTALWDGPLRLSVVSEDPWFAPDGLFVDAAAREVEVTLREGATVQGIVIDRRGRRAAGIPVTVTWSIGALRGLGRSHSDDRGAFRVVVPAGAAELVAEVREVPGAFSADEHPGYAGDAARVEGLRTGARDVVLELGEPAEFSGRFVGPDGESVRPREILLIPEVGPEDWSAAHRVVPETGRFHVSGLRRVSYWVYVRGLPAGYRAPPPVPIRMPTTDVRLVCPGGPSVPLASVRGVVDGGDLSGFRALWLPAAKAWSPKPSGRVAADGSFSITALPPGRGSLLVHHEEEEDDRYGFLQDVDPADGPFDVRLKRGQSIRGRVVGWPRNLLPRTRVVLSFPSGRDVYTTLDETGRFAFRGLPPARYDLRTSNLLIPAARRPPVPRTLRIEDVQPDDEREVILDLGL